MYFGGMNGRLGQLERLIAVLLIAVCFCACVEDDVKRGNEALRIGDYDRAVLNFSKALDVQPADRDARYGLALAYYAIAEDKERLKGRIDAAYSTGLFYLARATLAEDSRTNVLPLLDHSILLDTANYFSYNLKALILANQGRVEEAKKIYVYIVTKEPKFASAYLNLGNLYWEEHDVESAWDIWSMGHEALPKDAALARWTHVAEDSLKAMVQSGEL